ncbi:MAG: putative rane protein [Marmoricola sp.]|jgi:putative membrane protein|nr:putative rane protein [Marmoricola sp.]
MKYVVWLAVHALALGVAIWLFTGITLTGATTTDRVVTLVIVGAIFGIITSFVKPVVKFFSFPLIILTLGLALFVINALMLLLTSKIADSVGLNFHVEGFWTAVWAAIVISIASMIFEAVLPDPDKR